MTAQHETDLLIIGAGPYGLAMALVAKANDIDYLVTGKPMAFWKNHTPSGMYLRTPCDWHIGDSLERYLQTRQLTPEEIQPVPVEFFIGYIEDTIEKHHLTVFQTEVEQLTYDDPGYIARLDNGDTVYASNVVVATGYYPFCRIPEEYEKIFPEGRYTHSADACDPSLMAGKRCLIIGGRQSAFEQAGLLSRHAASVDIVYRHETPEFKPSDWSWALAYIERMRTDPAWYRRLPHAEQEAIDRRFWKEGRLELEAWLLEDLARQNITRWPKTTVVACNESPNSTLTVTLSTGRSLTVDHVILATGYQVDIRRLDYIARTNIIAGLAGDEGFPNLGERFQSNFPGLYFTGIHAVNDFGPFLFFVAGAFAAAEIIGKDIMQTPGFLKKPP